MKDFLLQMFKRYLVIKDGQAKVWTLGILPEFSQQQKQTKNFGRFDSVAKACSHFLSLTSNIF